MSKNRPQPSIQYPISEGIIGISGNSKIRATSELYFPFYYSKILCTVHNINYIFENMRDSILEIEFTLIGNQVELENMYSDEEWKIMGTKNFLKTYEGDIPSNPLPIFALMLNRTMYIKSAELKIDNINEIIIFDQSIDVMMLPESYPPVDNIEKKEDNYIFYEKKSTVFYSNFKLNKKYKLIITCYSGNPEFAPFFPYGKVEFRKIDYKSNSSIDIDIGFQKVYPEISKELPNHIKNTMSMHSHKYKGFPDLRPAYKDRGNTSVFTFNGRYGLPNITEKNKESFEKLQSLTLDKNDIKNSTFDNYGTYRFVFGLLIDSIKEPNKLEIIIRTPKNPIPIRIYEQLQNLPEYNDLLVEYEILNLGKIKRRLRIKTNINGYTEESSKIYTLHGINNKNGHKPLMKVTQTPRLKRGVLDTIVSAEKAVLSCEIYDVDSKEIIYEETYNIDILPYDQMVWSIKNAEGSITHNISPFVISWICPTDKDGLLDSVRAGALKYHPKKHFSINNSSQIEEIDIVVSAIYKYLDDDIGIHYVNQPFTSNMINNSQRILPPNIVLRNKVGNCIDLTITFASILEGLGLFSLIFLTPDHAFIGWGEKRITDKMLFLETTCLGQGCGYSEAKKIAKETFKNKFLYIGSPNPMPNSLLLLGKGCQIIDLNEMRLKGIYAIY